MPPDPGSTAKQIFLDAAELAEPERGAFLERALAEQPELRERVMALLRAHQRSDELQSLRLLPVDLEAGGRIGPYRLVELLGEGGFGSVWHAEQQEPVRRSVALKILKLGMDTKQVVRRFDTERQALALMDHAGIARVFDAGATEQGRPYFVMELVRGPSITEHCQEKRLAVEARLELFLAVCQAVQHAHQKGILHRDLKPSNILVATQDAAPLPKVIDFGIAKATSGELERRTLLTEEDQFVGSPAYMSPEQMELGNQDVDTRSDVYSLGVVLYEMLTGSLPFDLEGTDGAGYYEIFRRIRNQEPPRPSTRVTQLSDEDSAVFRAPAARLARLMRRDLDWIVMKALEKDRSRRYQSVGSLAADIERFLADEPVEASPPSVLYRLRKTVRRHRIMVTALAAVFVALALGAGLAVAGFVEAREQAQLALERGEAARAQELLAREARAAAVEQRARAEEERDRANAVVSLLQRMLNAPATERSKGPDYPLRALLDDFALGLGDELAGQPRVEATVRSTLGNSYLALDLPAAARPHLVRARELKHELLGPAHVDSLLADVEFARLLTEEGAFEEAEAIFRAAIPGLERDPTTPARLLAISCAQFAMNLVGQGEYDEAEVWTRRSLDGLDEDDAKGLVVLTNNMGLLAEERGAFEQAERVYREALARHEAAPGGAIDAIEKAKTLSNLGNVLMSLERVDEAEEKLRSSLAILDRLAGKDTSLAWRCRHNLGRVLTLRGRLEEAEALLAEALSAARAALPPTHPDLAAMTSGLSLLLEQQGRHDEALELGLEALAGRLAALGPDHPDLASSLYNLGSLLHREGRLDEAEAHLREALRIVLLHEAGRPYRPRVLSELALVREEQGDLAEATSLLSRTSAASLAIGNPGTAATARKLAVDLAARIADDLTAAEALLAGDLFREAEERAFRALDTAQDGVPRARASLAAGRVLTRAGAFEEAEPLLLDAWETLADQVEPRARAAEAILALYAAWPRADELEAWKDRVTR